MNKQNTLTLVNLHQLGELTGRGYRKIKELLGNLEPEQTGKEILYDAYKALPILFAARNEGALDFSNERAKLAQAQTEKTIIETEKLKQRLVSVEEVEQKWESSVLFARSKLLLLPKKMAFELKGITDSYAIEQILDDCIFDALTELSKGPDTEGTKKPDA